mmetsp:Transcript_39993/g.89703  ORF Transcript_39993/g.89703 Transcript_39993/m.89703 type:complete len:448 (+) Transcript_39993:122-1465(+)
MDRIRSSKWKSNATTPGTLRSSGLAPPGAFSSPKPPPPGGLVGDSALTGLLTLAKARDERPSSAPNGPNGQNGPGGSFSSGQEGGIASVVPAIGGLGGAHLGGAQRRGNDLQLGRASASLAPSSGKAFSYSSSSYFFSSPMFGSGGALAQVPGGQTGGPGHLPIVATAGDIGGVENKREMSYRDRQWEGLMAGEVTDLEALKSLSWNGVPAKWRPQVWQLLLGYLPSDTRRRDQTLSRKRREYQDAVAQFYGNQGAGDENGRASESGEQRMLRQILVDVPRTIPGVPLFHQAKVQRCLERLLFVWSLRHPASGYVQGMNDLVTPLFIVFLSSVLLNPDSPLYSPHAADADASGEASSNSSGGGGRFPRGECAVVAALESLDLGRVSSDCLATVEADAYWGLTKLLDNIQDHYTAGQPGLQRQIYRLEELIKRTDRALYDHLASNGVP